MGKGSTAGQGRHNAAPCVPRRVTYPQGPRLLLGRGARPIIHHMLQDAVPTARPRSPSLFAIKKKKNKQLGCRQAAFVQALACLWKVSEHISLR